MTENLEDKEKPSYKIQLDDLVAFTGIQNYGNRNEKYIPLVNSNKHMLRFAGVFIFQIAMTYISFASANYLHNLVK
jgi:hypothetical protein